MVKMRNTDAIRRLMPMKIALCDDDMIFASELKLKIQHICAKKDWPLHCEKYCSPVALLAADLSSVQIVFLDIDMPDIDGLSVAQQIREQFHDVIIVFVTSWIEYAPAGYCVNAFRYILKYNLDSELEACFDAIQEKIYSSQECINISTKDFFMEVALKDSLFFEGTSRRVVLLHLLQKTDNESPIECLGKLSDYEDRLQDKGFLRIQKSYLVNMQYVDKIRNYLALLRDGRELKVSEKNYSHICKQYVMWKGRYL